MIIAAYAGCGKTTFANTHADVCVEIASMPYTRILPVVKEEIPSIFSYDFDIREETKPLHYFVRTVDKEGLMQALEKYEKKVARYFK